MLRKASHPGLQARQLLQSKRSPCQGGQMVQMLGALCCSWLLTRRLPQSLKTAQPAARQLCDLRPARLMGQPAAGALRCPAAGQQRARGPRRRRRGTASGAAARALTASAARVPITAPAPALRAARVALTAARLLTPAPAGTHSLLTLFVCLHGYHDAVQPSATQVHKWP